MQKSLPITHAEKQTKRSFVSPVSFRILKTENLDDLRFDNDVFDATPKAQPVEKIPIN